MTLETYLLLQAFCISMTFTPGPNNMMLMASGANFGLRRSLPHMTGVAYGLPIMVILVGLGIIQIFDRWPTTYTILKIASLAYLLWLAWKIANAAQPETATTKSKPLTFFQAAGFQWVNPKAWSMCVGAVTIYASQQDLKSILIIAVAFAISGTGSALTWTSFGTAVRRFLKNDTRLRIYNWTMATLLVVTTVWVLLTS